MASDKAEAPDKAQEERRLQENVRKGWKKEPPTGPRPQPPHAEGPTATSNDGKKK